MSKHILKELIEIYFKMLFKTLIYHNIKNKSINKQMSYNLNMQCQKWLPIYSSYEQS